LDQEFNSLDAQREAGEAYIASQKNEGWTCLADRYDDGAARDPRVGGLSPGSAAVQGDREKEERVRA
jgi:hypothetical protein